LSKNLVVGKFSFKNAKGEAENLNFEKKFRSKIKFLSTRNLFCRKLASICQNFVANSQFCRKIATSGFAYFFNQRRRWRTIIYLMLITRYYPCSLLMRYGDNVRLMWLKV